MRGSFRGSSSWSGSLDAQNCLHSVQSTFPSIVIGDMIAVPIRVRSDAARTRWSGVSPSWRYAWRTGIWLPPEAVHSIVTLSPEEHPCEFPAHKDKVVQNLPANTLHFVWAMLTPLKLVFWEAIRNRWCCADHLPWAYPAAQWGWNCTHCGKCWGSSGANQSHADNETPPLNEEMRSLVGWKSLTPTLRTPSGLELQH